MIAAALADAFGDDYHDNVSVEKSLLKSTVLVHDWRGRYSIDQVRAYGIRNRQSGLITVALAGKI